MALVLPTQASAIADFLGVPLRGPDLAVRQVNALSNAANGSLTFMQHFQEDSGEALNRRGDIFVIADTSAEGRLKCSHVIVPNPRLAYAQVAQRFFEASLEARIASTAQVDARARIGKRISIGHFTVIDQNVEIGDDTVVADHVVIRARTRIGKRCIIRSNVVIGESGFGFDFAERLPIRIPHFGGVVLGDDVQIGCGAMVSCGTMEDTRIEDHAKIDNLVVVAHNCVVGQGAVVTAGAVLCGRTHIDSYVWVGANSTIREGGIKVGEGAMVGLGAVALAPVAPGNVVMGNPARILRKRGEGET